MEDKTIKVVNSLSKGEWKFTVDATLDIMPVTLLVGPNANEFLRSISVTGRVVMFDEGKADVTQIDEKLLKEAEQLMEFELGRMLEFATEMKLMTDINDVLPIHTPFADALKLLYSIVADGEVYFLAVEPTCGLSPQQAFFLGHLTAVFTQRVRSRGIKLYSIVSTNNLEFIRGATSTWTLTYMVRRNIDVKTKTITLTATKWERKDVVPPFFDSAALAIRRGILDFSKTT